MYWLLVTAYQTPLKGFFFINYNLDRLDVDKSILILTPTL